MIDPSQPYFEEWRLEQINVIKSFMAEIAKSQATYLTAMAKNNFETADIIFRSMKDCKLIIKQEKDWYVKNFGSPVSKTSSARSERIFILKK